MNDEYIIKQAEKERDVYLKENTLKNSDGGAETSQKTRSIKTEVKFYSADFDNLVDLVEVNGKTKFLTFDRKILDKVEINGQTFYPPESVSWLLPNAEKVLCLAANHSDDADSSDPNLPQGQCNACGDLYLNIIDYFKTFSEMLTEYHYHFLTLMAFHSHLIEKFNYSPILFLVGSGGRGKTPTLKALSSIARRGVFTETFREANIIRWGGDYKASLFFDTKNFPKKVEFANCEDVIYGRAERGVEAARVLFPEKGAFRDMKSFSTFGVTGATSNFMVDDLTELRCIVFHMPYSMKIFNIDVTPELGLDLKNSLTAFRLAHFHKPFINLKKINPGKMENYLIGIHQMVKTHFPQFEKEYLLFKEEAEEEKLENAENSFEARITKLLIVLVDYVEEGTLCLTYEDICTEYNKNSSKQIYPRSMSSILKGLGFRSRRNASGKLRGILYDEALIKHLKISYGIESLWGISSSPSSDVSEVVLSVSEKPTKIPFEEFSKETQKESHIIDGSFMQAWKERNTDKTEWGKE